MWDFSIQTDHVVEARRPDLVLVDKKERICKIIDFAVTGDSRIEEDYCCGLRITIRFLTET